MLVLPMTIAPACFSRDTASASCLGMKSLNWGKPQVDGSPATSNGSFSVTGMPRRGPASRFASAASAAFAASRARSKSRTTTALKRPSSASIRAIVWSNSSSAESFRAESASFNCWIEQKSHSDLGTDCALASGIGGLSQSDEMI
jgi:hypothetical protein